MTKLVVDFCNTPVADFAANGLSGAPDPALLRLRRNWTRTSKSSLVSRGLVVQVHVVVPPFHSIEVPESSAPVLLRRVLGSPTFDGRDTASRASRLR